ELLGARLRCYRLDVTEREQYAEVATQVRGDLGEVSLLFNNAGIIDSVSPSKVTYSMWDHVMGINLAGVYHGIQTFPPRMLASLPHREHLVRVRPARDAVRVPLPREQVRGGRPERVVATGAGALRDRSLGPLPRPRRDRHRREHARPAT